MKSGRYEYLSAIAIVGSLLVALPAFAQSNQYDRGEDTKITLTCTTEGYGGEPGSICPGLPTDDRAARKFAILQIWNNLDRTARIELSGPSNYEHSITDKRSSTIQIRPGSRYEIHISAGALVSYTATWQNFEREHVYNFKVDTTRQPTGGPESDPGVDPEANVSGGGSEIIFSDWFDSMKPEWQQVSGFWETTRGMMVQKSDDPRDLNAIRYIKTPRVSDATIETQLRVRPYRPSQWTNSEADQQLQYNIRYIVGAGIIFRMKDPDNYYMFRLAGEEGAVLGKMVGGEWTDIENPRVRDYLEGLRLDFRDQDYRLKVEVYGSRIQCYINDEPVINAADSTFTLGNVGLVTFKSAAEFDHIKISR